MKTDALAYIEDTIQTVLDWFEWAIDVATDFHSNPNAMVPPPQSAIGKTLEARLADATAHAKALSVPAFVAPLSEAGDPDGVDFDTMRAALAGRVREFHLAGIEFSGARLYIARFRVLLTTAEQQGKMMGFAKNVFYEAMPLIPHPQWMETMVYLGSDLEDHGTLMLAHADLLATLNLRFSESRAIVEERRQILKSAGSTLTQSLNREIDKLAKEALRLKDLWDTLDFHVKTNAALLQELKNNEAYLHAAYMDYQNNEDGMADINAEIEKLTTDGHILKKRADEYEYQINNFKWIFKTQEFCPNKNEYDVCDHLDIKLAFDQKVESWKSSLSDDRARLDKVAAAKKLAQSKLTAMKAASAKLKATIAKFEQVVAQKAQEYKQDTVMLELEKTHAFQETWKSRANEHTTASQANLAQVSAQLTTLSIPVENH